MNPASLYTARFLISGLLVRRTTYDASKALSSIVASTSLYGDLLTTTEYPSALLYLTCIWGRNPWTIYTLTAALGVRSLK